MVCLVQQAGKWFSLSLALGTDIVANINGNLPSDIPYYRDRARWRPPSYFQPHGGPITHRSQDRNLTLQYTPCSQSYSSRVDSYVIHEPPFDEIINSGIGNNNYSVAWNPFHLLPRQWTIAWLLETSCWTFQLYSRCVLLVQLERYSYAHSWVNPRLLPL